MTQAANRSTHRGACHYASVPCEMNGFMLQMKASSYLKAVLDQEGPAQTSWCSEWAVHVNKPSSMQSITESHL
jgi:hypothetical protein